MITFKEFLTEASSGKSKWEKYFADGDVQTTVKSGGVLLDVFGNPTKKSVERGDVITVLQSDEYKPTVRVQFKSGEYLMKLADIEKPFKMEQSVSVNLKPDVLGLFGAMTMKQYPTKLKAAIKSHSEIPELQGAYLLSLVDLAQDIANEDLQNETTNAYYAAGVDSDTAFKNTVNTDFMEALGPFFVVNEKPEYAAGGCRFPELGNEPLYDFTMKAKKGASEKIDSFSSKKSGGNTNTLKVTEVLKAIDTDSSLGALKKKRKLELELLRIIQENSVKTAPGLINDWLTKNFKNYEASPAPTDNTEIARLEAAVAKFINEKSGLEFTELVQVSVPDLWYVKSKIDTKGLPKVEPLKSGRELGNVRLRSKSSPGHLSDKLGFAL